ncbi:MAG: glycosyltransferase family 4 protein [Chloroflexota bacterium]
MSRSGKDKKRLAIVSPLPPHPPLAGGTAHLHQAIQQLARFYHIDLYTLATDPTIVTWGPLQKYCGEMCAFGRIQPHGLSLDPPAVRQEYAPTLHAHLQQHWATHPPDLVQLEFTSMAQYVTVAQQYSIPVVCTALNVAFLAQVRRAQQESNPLRRVRRWLGALSLWRYELLTLRRCNLVVALGESDAIALRRWLPQLSVIYIPSGINLDQWPVCFTPTSENEVLFVGSYLHPPNVEGALWLAREVWPRVRQIRPNARLTLAGRTPPPELTALATSNLCVPGTVDDLHPYYARASLIVAPIFWGSGVRIKLLEAMACGLPIVTTALAAEGIGLRHEQSALFAENTQDFATAIVRLLDDTGLRTRLGTNGRAIVEQKYDWQKIGEQLYEAYQPLLV